ncbi:hypothetical protein [Trujillonella humicola]|uniref:hypothetical protein n=1 Tax=Trujillonella humicola TaxID=3383699 RepID=UPI00390640A0
MRALRSYGLPLLAFGLPAGVIVGLVVGVVAGSATDGLLAGVVGGALAGGVFALLTGTTDLLADREARPGERHGPRQAASVQVRGGPDLPDRVAAALSALPAQIQAVDPAGGRFTARTGWTWRSFGEEVSVQLTGDPHSPTAHVTSRPVVPTTVLDYGKGRQNVHRVLAALEEHPDAGRPMPPR